MRKAPKRTQRNTTCDRKRFVAALATLGMVRKSRMSGTIPKRNVGPGCAFQQEGRIHQTSTQSTNAVMAISLSSVLNDWLFIGIRRYTNATAQLPIMKAS